MSTPNSDSSRRSFRGVLKHIASPRSRTPSMAENDFKVLVGLDKPTNVDVVFLGFGKKSFETWDTLANENQVIPWPRAFLAGDLPETRISAYHYQAEEWKHYQKHAKDLCEKLDKLRENDTPRHPIVLVAHSLAGLVVAKVLENTSVCKDVQALVLFATPFQEPDGRAPVSILAGIVKAYGYHDEDVTLAAKVLNQLPGKVSRSEGKINVATFVERPIPTALVPRKAVGGPDGKNFEVQSLEGDHKNICKFKTKDGCFVEVLDVLQRYAKVEQEPERGRDGGIYVDTVNGGFHKDNSGNVQYFNGKTDTMNVNNK